MKLHELRLRVESREQIQRELSRLYEQRTQLVAKMEELERVKNSEQRDVDRLQGRSLAAFFYNVCGKMDERMSKERREAYEAAVKYDAAKREYDEVCEDIEWNEKELESLAGCAEEYEAAKLEKLSVLKVSGGAKAKAVMELEERMADLHFRLRESHEAYDVGCSALCEIQQILAELDDAEGLGMWDIFGGGLLTDIAKHESIDNAQAMVEQLQLTLRRFRTEVADVSMDVDIDLRMDDFLSFADFFFDGLFADMAALEHIENSRNQVLAVQSRVKQITEQLEKMDKDWEKEYHNCAGRLEELALERE